MTKPLQPLIVSDNLTPPPPSSPKALKGVLISESAIQDRIDELAVKINTDYGQEPLLVIGVLTGTILFFADLVRRLNGPIEMDFIGISSYRDGTTSGEINITGANKTDLKDRRVLVVDDILDGGQTLSTVIRELSAQQPKELKTCVLLEKKERRQVPINADYVGFHIPNYFVVGFGLDYAERYRNLPYVGVLDEDQL
ncbi:hypoxanthine phosphoribosyltransferase [bacterium]|nr:hypoxanthine phosphoribosyltransferase [Verrucomicrobiota bacterium]MDA7680288.1 hypoxanthine phosphoribosyltransferase [bacterium]